jgi:hypothetical protein
VLFEVSRHVLILPHVALVAEIHHQLRIPLDDETLDAQGTRHPQTGKKSLVLGDIVGDLLWFEAELDGIAKLVPGWRGENGPSPRAGEVEGTIKVQDLETWGLLFRKRGLHLWRLIDECISPLSSELS